MAKLSARGRFCLVEVEREYTEADLQRRHDRAFPAGDPLAGPCSTTWERVTKRVMSDGNILERRTVRFRPDWLDKDGRRHDYGWNVVGKLKAGLTARDYVRIYAADDKDRNRSPWTCKIEHERMADKVLRPVTG